MMEEPTITAKRVQRSVSQSAPMSDKPLSELWWLHGKAYDFTDFVPRHPGGEYMILLGKGRDCTELFESVHALSDKPHTLLKKYRVETKEKVPEEVFKWEKGGFYDVLTQRVRKAFPTKDSQKASYMVYIKILAIMAVMSISWALLLQYDLLYLAPLNGGLQMSIGFCLMHEASHGGLSKKAWVNYLGLLYSSWMLWNPWMWLLHHCYGHHSYTGIYKMDPDIINSKVLVRKHPSMRKSKMMKYQHWYVWPVMMLLPNQQLGQVLQYRMSQGRKRVFGVPLSPSVQDLKILDTIIQPISYFVNFFLPFFYLSPLRAFLAVFISYSAMGSAYFFCVAPNHDQHDTVKNHDKGENGKIDWGEQQVRASGNHSNSHNLWGRLVTSMFGGMNYQIEHHLFPAMSHIHYHRMAPIVKQTAEEFGIPYNSGNSWFEAMASFHVWMKKLSTDESLAPPKKVN